jgi:hypothetical protein
MSTQNSKKGKKLKTLDEMIAAITVDAYGDDEQLWAFRQAFEDDVALPADGFVIGEPVSVIAVDYDGNERRGLTARCRRENGSEYLIAVSDVVLPQTSVGANYIAAYRRWLNLDPYLTETQKLSRRGRQHKAAEVRSTLTNRSNWSLYRYRSGPPGADYWGASGSLPCARAASGSWCPARLPRSSR